MFDKQAIFDKVVAHLRKQQVQALCPDRMGVQNCAYRGSGGTSCAIGCLIPDSLYDSGFEQLGCPVNARDVKPGGLMPGDKGYAEVLSRKTKLRDAIVAATGAEADEDFNFLSRLQRVHDQNQPDSWEYEFANFAEMNGVAYTPKSDS